jgi:hypothetical protein
MLVKQVLEVLLVLLPVQQLTAGIRQMRLSCRQEKFLFQNITDLCDPFFKPELFAKHEDDFCYDLMISTRYSTDETFKHN